MSFIRSLDRKGRRDWIESSAELESKFVQNEHVDRLKIQEGEKTDGQDTWEGGGDDSVTCHFSDRVPEGGRRRKVIPGEDNFPSGKPRAGMT